MRILETILKLGFLLTAVMTYAYQGNPEAWLCALIIVSAILGIVLLFNKKASYNFTQSERDLLIRRIEGIVLIVFAAVAAYMFWK